MKYSKELIDKICKHLKQGATITTTCEAVGISRETFYDWMKKKPDVSDTIKKAMSIPDKKVENALFKSATMGHRYIEKEFKAVAVGEKIKMIPVKTVTKIIPPNVTAQIFYLKNRQPDEWSDKQDIEHSGGLNIKVERIITDKRPEQ